jgi:hypothetical protein
VLGFLATGGALADLTSVLDGLDESDTGRRKGTRWSAEGLSPSSGRFGAAGDCRLPLSGVLATRL